MPKQCEEIWINNYISLNETMTDNEIINILEQNLNNKELLNEMSENMYKQIHSQFGYQNIEQKILNICDDINKKT